MSFRRLHDDLSQSKDIVDEIVIANKGSTDKA